MQPASALTVLFQHNLWANLQLIGRCAALSDAQLDASIIGGFGSIRDTLEHIVSAEQSYLSRISTGRRLERREGEPRLGMAELAAAARAAGEGLIAWAPRVAAEEVVQIDWDGTMRDVPKTILLAQAINHATEHRAQIMAIMTQLGVEPPELDGWGYFDQGAG